MGFERRATNGTDTTTLPLGALERVNAGALHLAAGFVVPGVSRIGCQSCVRPAEDRPTSPLFVTLLEHLAGNRHQAGHGLAGALGRD